MTKKERKKERKEVTKEAVTKVSQTAEPKQNPLMGCISGASAVSVVVEIECHGGTSVTVCLYGTRDVCLPDNRNYSINR